MPSSVKFFPLVMGSKPRFGVGYGLGYDPEAMVDHRGYEALGDPIVRLWGANYPDSEGLRIAVRGAPIRKNGQITTLDDLTEGCGPFGVACNATLHPGSWWELGNEPNVNPDPINPGLLISPARLAVWFHDVSEMILDLDPGATIVSPSFGPGSGDWDMVAYANSFWWAYYDFFDCAPPVDVWSIHPYPVHRTVPGHIQAFKAWSQQYGNQPLIVTEIGWLGKASPEFVIAKMDQWYDEMFPGVLMAFWFIPHHEIIVGGEYLWKDTFLFTYEGGLTELGQHFRDL